jgi:hypothetical protein
VCHDIDTDLIINTYNVEVDLEGDLLLSLPVTRKVLEFLGIRRTGSQLWHRGQGASNAICVHTYPQLGSQKGPILVGNEGHLQHPFVINFDTHFSGFHGLLVTASYNRMTFRFIKRLDEHLWVGTVVVRAGCAATTVTLNCEAEPTHPGVAVAQSVFIGKSLVSRTAHGTPV